MPKTTDAPQQRAYASGVALAKGMLSFHVDFVPRSRPNLERGSGLHHYCTHPDHEEPAGVHRAYVCDMDHVSAEADLPLGRFVEGHGIVTVDKNAVSAAIIGGATDKLLEITAHPADEVEQSTVPAGVGYRLRVPDKAGAVHHEMFAAITKVVAEHPELAFLGETILRGSRSLYRLTVWRGQLVAESLIHPYELADLVPDELPSVEVRPDRLRDVEALLCGDVEPFNPEVYFHDDRAKVADLLAKTAEGETTEAAAEVEDDPFAAITAAVAPAKPAKKAAKKRAAKKVA